MGVYTSKGNIFKGLGQSQLLSPELDALFDSVFLMSCGNAKQDRRVCWEV